MTEHTVEGGPRILRAQEDAQALTKQWRGLARAATLVAVLTSPALFLYLYNEAEWSLFWSIVATIISIGAFRGLVDVAFRKFIPWPTLFGIEDQERKQEDATARRRAFYWQKKYKLLYWIVLLFTLIWAIRVFSRDDYNWWNAVTATTGWLADAAGNPAIVGYAIIFPLLMVMNFLILFGPLVFMGISQMRSYEPGDADWGVRLDHVRGQVEAKDEVRKVVNLWQSGEAFEKAGGKRERGLLFLGAPGTGKTMLAKAIATGFNSPIVTIPGSGFAQAQPLDAKVLTPRGWTTMGEIEVGDEVIDPEGGTATVVGVFPQGERDVFRVTFSDGSSTECDLDHLWQIRRDGRRPWHVEPLSSIKQKLETDTRQSRPYIPLVKNLEFEEQELPVDPYLLGMLLGDGCFTGTPPVLIAPEPELVGAAAARLPTGLTAEENSGKAGAYYLTAGKRGRLANPLTSELRSLGLFGHGSLTKFVPDVYKYAKSTTRLEVLHGLMDTDGCVRSGDSSETVFATSSPTLADDVVFLVRSLGGTATKRRTGTGSYVHPSGETRPAAPAWHVTVALSPGCDPFRLERKRESWNRVWEPSRRIVSIEKVGRKDVQCIKLDSENELYVTDDFVVTHNTFIGMDVVIVRYLARKAKRLASKWGGQCIVFIDEIDAVGMRRSALQPGMGGGYSMPQTAHDVCFYGDNGALTPTGDLILQSNAWQEKLWALRAERERADRSESRWANAMNAMLGFMFPGGMGGMGQLALNQLLVVMDGIDNPPFLRRTMTNRLNTWLDALYFVPRKLGKVPLRLRQARPTGNQIYFIGATNVPLQALDPALTRSGRMGRHVWFRTPTKRDRLDIFDLYIEKVDHEAELDRPERRDELARITKGYSPAMIEQVCSMALTYAHHDGRERFGREDILEAMTTIEAGTAIGWDYVPDEARATAIHEAGHAVTAHVYLKGAESTRLSIKRRGFTGGHHQAAEKEDRFGHFRSEEFANLIWSLGAMAAERVFYGENTTGVGGDVQSATALAATMVGAWGMGPEQIELNGRFKTDEERDAARKEVSRRFRAIGNQIVGRTGGGGPFQQDPIAGVLSDRFKRELAAELIGQAYVAAHHLVDHNRDAVEKITEALLQRKEIYGDELLEILNQCKLEIPAVDLTDPKTWPQV